MKQSLAGKIIVIEGLDGAGKSTQIELLHNYFHTHQQDVAFLHFPRLDTGIFGDLVSRFLQGKFGKLEDVHPQLVALIYAEDRNDNKHVLYNWQNEGKVILLDRYVYSNIAFQCAKLKSTEEKKYLADWIFNLEYNIFKIPKPDFSFYLEVPFDFTRRTLSKNRSGVDRNYLEGNMDIHEEDLGFQEKVKLEYDAILREQEDISRILCVNSKGEMRSKDDIHQEIIAHLANLKL